MRFAELYSPLDATPNSGNYESAPPPRVGTGPFSEIIHIGSTLLHCTNPSRRDKAMDEKRILRWPSIDMLVIIISLIVILTGIWIAY